MFTNKKLLELEKMVSLGTIVLAAEEADRFLDYVIDESVFKSHARIVKMSKPTKNIRALSLGTGRFLKPEAGFSATDYKTSFGHNKLALTSVKVRGAVFIHDDDLEDGPEGNAFVTHILRMIADTVANELDEAWYISDTADLGGFADDDIRSLWDGFRYRITNSASGETYENDASGSSYVIDASADTDYAGGIAVRNTSAPYQWEFKFHDMIKRMPTKYRKDPGKLRFFCNPVIVDAYVEAITDRSTALGDAALLVGGQMKYRNIPIVEVPNMSITLDASGVHGGGSYTDVMLTHEQNLIIGLQRQIKIESERSAADEGTYWFYSLRGDVCIENVEAVVLLEKITY